MKLEEIIAKLEEKYNILNEAEFNDFGAFEAEAVETIDLIIKALKEILDFKRELK